MQILALLLPRSFESQIQCDLMFLGFLKKFIFSGKGVWPLYFLVPVKDAWPLVQSH